MSEQKSAESKVIVITGASTGIGEATAKKLVDEGHKVALVARNTKKLDALVRQLGQENAFQASADVSNYEALYSAFDSIKKHFGKIDGVFANAGTGVNAPGIENGNIDEWTEMLGVNINGLLYSAKVSLPMLKETQGHFLLTSSVAGRVALKGSVYGASKWFAYGFGMNLAEEMREWGGKCTTICPGMVNTPFFDEPKEEKLTPEDIAEAVVYALSASSTACVREVYVMPTDH